MVSIGMVVAIVITLGGWAADFLVQHHSPGMLVRYCCFPWFNPLVGLGGVHVFCHNELCQYLHDMH